MKSTNSDNQTILEKKSTVVEPETQEQTVTIFGRNVKKSDVIKLIGLAAFFVICIAILAALWPSLSKFFEPDGPAKVIEDVQDKGAFGVVMLFGLQFLQIIIAFIPGEVVQMAAGMIYGPIWGSLLIWVGCIFSSAIVYLLVHKLGAPFVQAMVSTEHLAKFEKFEQSGKLTLIVFILFLIPAMPKDVFTYLVPLTNMPLKTFLITANVARIPGIVLSTYAASDIASGDVTTGVIILAVALVLCALGVIFRNKIFEKLGK